MKIVRINNIPKIKHNVTQFSKPNVTFESKLNTEKFKTFFYDLYRKIFPYGLSGPRKLPNYISDVNEDFFYENTGKKLVFSIEDELKMKNMSAREYIEYGKKLIKDGKYTLVDDV